MGPSILAAAFTTICSAIIVLSTFVSLFQKFARVLFYTVIMATLGSMIVFISLTTYFGQSEPTFFIDSLTEKLKRSCSKHGGKNLKETDKPDETQSVSH
jgi:hypothetical protein